MQLHLCLSGRKTEISIKLFYVGTNFIAGILFIILTLTVNKFIAAILLPPPMNVHSKIRHWYKKIPIRD